MDVVYSKMHEIIILFFPFTVSLAKLHVQYGLVLDNYNRTCNDSEHKTIKNIKAKSVRIVLWALC